MARKPQFFCKLILYFFCLTIILALGCAVPEKKPCLKDGQDCSKIYYQYKTFIDDWDSCYLLGCSYLKCGCRDLAIEEFKKAISGRPKDERRARTYGMHFLGYFPHRETGIIYYQMNRPKEAIKELEKSLQDSPSSKAKYFLNKARKNWLQQNNLDKAPPRLQISFPPSPYYLTNKLSLSIEGRAEDDRFISDLSINDEPVFIELSSPSIPFTHTVYLARGQNRISIVTGDLFNKTTKSTWEVIVDRKGPIINFSHSPLEYALREGRILVQGVILDESGVDKFSINEMPIDIKKGEMAEFSHWIDLSSGIPRLSFLALDLAGNETSGYLELSLVEGSGRRHRSALRPGLADKVCSNIQKQDLIQVASLNMLALPLLAGCENDNQRDGPYQLAKEPSSEPFLFFEPLPKATVFNQVYLYGKIQYKTSILAINILLNNRLISRVTYDSGLLGKLKSMLEQKGEKVLLLSEIIELDSGENRIVIEITNEAGITKEKIFSIMKKEEEILDESYRLCASILPVVNISDYGGNAPSMERYASYKLSEAFVNQKRFQVVEREKIEEIIEELKLSVSDLADKNKALQIGRLLSAELIFLNCYLRRSESALELGGTMADVETTRHIHTEDIYLEGDTDEIIDKAAEILAMKIRNYFPLCKGKVLRKKGRKIFVSIGRDQKIMEDAKLLVYKEKEWDTQILSDARVERLFEDHSRAVLSRREKKDEIMIEDLVITK